MKIAFVMHLDLKPLIEPVIAEMWPKVQAEYLIYTDYHDAPRLIHNNQHLWDGILFAGRAPYECCVKQEPQEILWDIFPVWNETFFKALLIALQKWGDITRLSIDSFYPETVDSSFEELGLKKSELNNALYVSDVTNPLHNKNTLEFHLNNWHSGKFSGCITRLSAVAAELQKRNIPVVFSYPTCDIVREQLKFMLKLHIAQGAQDNLFTVFAISLVRAPKNHADAANEYLLALERERIISQVYRYALQINGSVAITSHSEYLIFSNQNCIDLSDQGFRQLELLDEIGGNTHYIVHIGVGNSNSIRKAHSSAIEAQCRIRNSPASRAFCLLPNNKGFEISQTREAVFKGDMSAMLSYVARKSGISLQTLYSIYTFISERNTDEFTADELAKYLMISVRSTNRLLEKLEAAHFICVTGKSYENTRGRPKRLLRFIPNGQQEYTR